MARESGSFREDYIASLANLETALVAYATAVDTRLTAASGSDAGQLVATVSISMMAENDASGQYTHKCSFTIDTGSVTDALGDFTTLIAALEVFLQAILTESDYTTVKAISVTATITGSN